MRIAGHAGPRSNICDFSLLYASILKLGYISVFEHLRSEAIEFGDPFGGPCSTQKQFPIEG